MLEEEARCFCDVLRPRLAEHGVHLLGWDDLSEEQQEEISQIFDTRISPVLTPLSLDEAHPFPYVSNLSTSWAFRLGDPVNGEPVFVRVKVPSELPQWLRVRTGSRRAGACCRPGRGDRRERPEALPGMVVDSMSRSAPAAMPRSSSTRRS